MAWYTCKGLLGELVPIPTLFAEESTYKVFASIFKSIAEVSALNSPYVTLVNAIYSPML